MDQPATRDILFDVDDIALLRAAITHLHDHYDAMSPAFSTSTEFGVDRVRALQAILNNQEKAPDGIKVRLSKEDMTDLGQVLWWSFDWFEDHWSQAGISEQAQSDLMDRIDALRESVFSA